MNRDELIEHLREEIAKRDMRIGELENDASYYAARNEELRSELATPTPIPDAAPVQQVSVPVEPTIEMAEALYFDGKDYTHSKDFDDFKEAWPQMLLVARKLNET